VGNQLKYKKEIKPFYEQEDLQEDEIDLFTLWRILVKRKNVIILTTSLAAVSGFIFSFWQTPIYEVKSNLKIGYIGETLLEAPEILERTLKIVFKVARDRPTFGEEESLIASQISKDKNAENFLVIKTEGLSNDEALKKNEEIVKYVQDRFQDKIDQYILKNKNQIKNFQREIVHIRTVEMKDIDVQIKLLKTQDIVKINEEIQRLKTQDIVNIDRDLERLQTQDIVRINEEISRLKSQDIVEIDEEIDFFQNLELVSLQSKIDFQIKKLNEYSHSVSEINTLKQPDKTSSMISSIQMLNYQNLILNAQKDIEDLKLKRSVISNKTIPELKRQKENVIKVTIKDLNIRKNNILDVDIKNLLMKKENILNVTISNLQRERNKIQNETIRKLENQRDIVLKAKIAKLKEEIETLKFNISEQNLQNSKVLGGYIMYKFPLKPNKNFIVLISFLMGFILSILLVFFLESISHQKSKKSQI